MPLSTFDRLAWWVCDVKKTIISMFLWALIFAMPAKSIASDGSPVASGRAKDAMPLAKTPGSWSGRVRHPVDWLNWGAEFRVRHEYHNNTAGFDSQIANQEFSYQRYRSRLWLAVQPFSTLTLNTRLTTEPRYYFKPGALEGYQRDEIALDQLHLHYQPDSEHPLSITVGRQDIVSGNRWLFHDGTTRDGSRTDYFNAARLAYRFDQANTTVNTIYFDNLADSGYGLPVINNQGRYVTEEDSRGLILYAINKSLPATQLDGFFVYKHDRKMAVTGNNADLYIFGGRVETKLNDRWTARLECAPEFGVKNGRTLKAFGLNSLLTYAFHDRHDNRLSLAYEYLSGDNPATSDNEGFDPIWGRRAQYSELLVFTFTVEGLGRSAEWSNLQRLAAGWHVMPAKKVEWENFYHALFANQNPLGTLPGYSAGGAFRGHLVTSVLKFDLTRALSGHLMAEVFFPGDYYASPKGDLASFLRFQLLFQF